MPDPTQQLERAIERETAAIADYWLERNPFEVNRDQDEEIEL